MKRIIALLLILALGISTAVSQTHKSPPKKKSAVAPAVKPFQETKKDNAAAKSLITFYELGSVKCIPCKAMQPVMRSVEEKYRGQLSVVFYDVWKEDQKHYAEQFGIQVIPTQVFVDKDGKELMRHTGFFAEKDIDAFLQSKGLQPKQVAKGL